MTACGVMISRRAMSELDRPGRGAQLGQHAGLRGGDPVGAHGVFDAPALPGEGVLHQPQDRAGRSSPLGSSATTGSLRSALRAAISSQDKPELEQHRLGVLAVLGGAGRLAGLLVELDRAG